MPVNPPLSKIRIGDFNLLRVIESSNGAISGDDPGIAMDGGELGAIPLLDRRTENYPDSQTSKRHAIQRPLIKRHAVQRHVGEQTTETPRNSRHRSHPSETAQTPHKAAMPALAAIGDELEVFVYRDAALRLVATLDRPLARVGECAFLEVMDISNAGAFLNWGLQQQLLLPKSRQQKPVRIGQKCVVYLELDRTSERVIASTRLSQHLNETPTGYQVDDSVSIMVIESSQLGFKVLVDGCYLGLLYRNEVFQPLHPGQKLVAFIKALREDGKVDLTLATSRAKTIDSLGDTIIRHLKHHCGYSPLSDRSDPQHIYQTFKVSKKAFKRAIGALYKARLIVIEDDGIRLTSDNAKPEIPNPESAKFQSQATNRTRKSAEPGRENEALQKARQNQNQQNQNLQKKDLQKQASKPWKSRPKAQSPNPWKKN